MYTGKNPTALQSQQWLTRSLISLMEEKPYAAITVGDICRRADLSRQTFYNFFSDKEEVLRACLREKYEAQFSHYSTRPTMSIEEVVGAFAQVLAENRPLLASMLRSGLDSILADEISKCVSLFAHRFVADERNDALLPYSEALLSGALAQLIVFWFKQAEPVPLGQLTALLTDFFRGQLYVLR